MPAAKSLRPVKQKRALLESNPPRDNWIERRRNKKRLRIWGGPNLPKWKKETFISEPEHALKTHRPRSDKAPNGQPKTNGKKYLSFFSHAAFHAEPVQERFGGRNRKGPAHVTDERNCCCCWEESI
jgi:hypothetical protein